MERFNLSERHSTVQAPRLGTGSYAPVQKSDWITAALTEDDQRD